jgi:hypothetical protein
MYVKSDEHALRFKYEAAEGIPMDTPQTPLEKAPVDRPAEIMVPCKVCREPVRQGAKKCIHCDSMLDWRGWLGISETALALLVALVSVVGATAPRIVELFTPQFSNLKVNVRQVFSNNIELAAVNEGHKSSELVSASISARTEDGRVLEPIPLQVAGILMVPAEQGTLVGLAIQPVAIPTFLDWPHPKIQSAKLAVVVNEYHEQPQTKDIDVPIEYFRLFCRATEDADSIFRHPGQPVDNRSNSKCLAPPK